MIALDEHVKLFTGCQPLNLLRNPPVRLVFCLTESVVYEFDVAYEGEVDHSESRMIDLKDCEGVFTWFGPFMRNHASPAADRFSE